MSKSFSIEDGNLSSASIITGRTRDYVDIDLTFEAKPAGDVYKKVDAAAVKQSVKNLLLTNPGEKPFLPLFGGGLSGLIFELVDDDSEEEIEEAIKMSIENYEPRAKVQEVIINSEPDANSIRVKIVFQVITTEDVIVLETTVSRVR